MSKTQKSGVAVFMYCVIGASALTAAVCLGLYYSGIFRNGITLWVGIVFFMIMYHLWVRIIMGNVSKLFDIKYTQPWFRELPFEKGLYRLLGVRRWKDRALTYNPEHFSLKTRSLEEIAQTMAKSEVDHWINEVISLVSILFSLIWGEAWVFALTAVAAMVFDAQFIVIQRYNRPRVLRLMKRKAERIEACEV